MWLTHISPQSENVILNFLLYSKKKKNNKNSWRENCSMRKIYESVTLFAQIHWNIIMSQYGKYEILRVNKVICFFSTNMRLGKKKTMIHKTYFYMACKIFCNKHFYSFVWTFFFMVIWFYTSVYWNVLLFIMGLMIREV